MAFKIFRRLADMLDLDETSKTAGYSVVVNATADGYELSNVVGGGGGGGAPTDATYITQTAHASLSAEQALSALSTGVVKVTTGTGVLSTAVADTDYAAATHATRHQNGGADEISIAGLDGTPVELTNHLNDATAAHAASAISADSTTLVGVGTDVQAVLEELDNGIADHLADTSAAHAASAISADSTTLVGVGTDVQAVLEELDNAIAAAYTPGGTDVALADGGTGASLADPNADRILFWDDSAGQITWLTAGTNLTITSTTIDASGTGGAATPDFAANFMLMGA